MDKMAYEQLKHIDSRFEEDVMECFDYEKSAEYRSVSGGTSRSSVIQHISTLRKTVFEPNLWCLLWCTEIM